MPSALLDAAAVVICAHGGRAHPAAPSARVRVSGAPIVTAPGPWPIAGCPLPPQAGGPCLIAQFTTAATRVTSLGQPVLLTESFAMAAPTGAPLTVASAQNRVRGV
ncbi:MAG: hypothetical protein V4514_05990 [Pseudomonadota bacterium]|uniref:hypothetical protein n=1 Tax=unclassified Phenylobacterium TaxID=2640670 RepID=UPI0006FA63F3|nr:MULTISPECIES: hypothetical protein [unclassified Phenylobacterium]KRB46753.1 hypothetical protein ASE02_20015 [Phenylobacterium sp. Root700]MBT9470305.1 hypothetical protein [Phenylobacterium sp.]